MNDVSNVLNCTYTTGPRQSACSTITICLEILVYIFRSRKKIIIEPFVFCFRRSSSFLFIFFFYFMEYRLSCIHRPCCIFFKKYKKEKRFRDLDEIEEHISFVKITTSNTLNQATRLH